MLRLLRAIASLSSSARLWNHRLLTLARHLKARARGDVVPDPADPVALAAYDREHRDTARWIFHGTNAIVRLFTEDRPAARLVRQATLHLAERLPPVKALIVRQLVDA